MSKQDGQMFESIRHLFAANLKEAKGSGIEEILGLLDEVEIHLNEAIDEANNAVNLASRIPSIEGVVAGQLESYLIGHLQSWIEDENQPGSIASLREYLQGDEWKEEVEEAKKKINEIVTDIESLPDAQLYTEREKLNSNLSKASPSDKRLFAEKRIVALNAEIQKRGLSEKKVFIKEPVLEVNSFKNEKEADFYIGKEKEKGMKSFKFVKKQKSAGEWLVYLIQESKINEQLPNEDPTEPHPGNEAPDKIDAPKADTSTDDEEEPVVDQNKIKEVPPSGEEKEYLGSKGSDMYFYIKTVYGNAGAVEDLLLLDASENQLLAAKETNIDPTKIIDFILVAIKKAEITLISVDIIQKYILEPKAEEEEKAEAEKTDEVGKDLERQTPAEEPAAITTPETLPTDQPTEFKG